MLRKILSRCAVLLFSLALAGGAFAGETKGKITKVGNGGREITVKAKGGKEVTVRISNSRTKLEGVGSRDELKEGQNVVVDHEGDSAKMVKVSK